MEPERANDSGALPTDPERSLKRRKLELSDSLETSRQVLSEAVKEIDTLRNEKEKTAFSLLSAIAALRSENGELRKRCESLETNGETAADLANTRMEDANSSEQRAVALEQEIADAKIAFDHLQREKLANEQTLVEKMRRSADDAALIQNLRNQVTELVEYRASAASRITAQNASVFKLARDSETTAAESAGMAKRCAFLESERVRLSADLTEVCSQLDIANGEHAAHLKSNSGLITSLRDEIRTAQANSATLTKQVAALHAQICGLQDQREQSRVAALNEAKKMEDIVRMHKEAAEDAEGRAKKYHDLLAMVTESNKELARKPPPGRKSLDAAAEALLKEMQMTLDQKLEDLAVQREELEKAQASERKIASEFQTLVREAEDSKRVSDQAVARLSTTEQENKELKKRVAQLEERILFIGSPHPSTRTPSRTDFGGSRMAARTGLTPPSARQEPNAMDTEADAGVFSSAIDEMRQLREKHEAVIAALAARRAGRLTPAD